MSRLSKPAALLLTCCSSLCAAPNYEIIPDTNTLTIQTPSLAERKTAKIRLANGLEAYLVSDPEADQSAAALAVSVGSWSDPAAYPGMAHFLEHMLFLGNEKYPKEDAFMGFVRDHGGLVNAYTATDRTVYMFSTTNASFAEGLDQFAHFFIDPLFDQSGVGRELHAVDQEHSKNIEKDGWRQWMILKQTGNPKHPNAQFSTGNAETLGHIPRTALLDWYNTYYSANRMHLVAYSNLPLDELTKLIVEDFSPVPDRKAAPPIPYDHLFSSQQKGHWIFIEPVKDLRQLDISWDLPRTFCNGDESKSADLIAYALRSGGENSLLERLKKEHLAEDLGVEAQRFSPDHLLFNLSISLTKEGVKELDLVLKRAFESLHILEEQGLPSYLYDEMTTLAKMGYQYQSRQNAFHFVMSTADELVFEPLSSYPQHTLLPETFEPQRVEALLHALSPQQALFIVMAPESLTGVHSTQTERWNGGTFAISPLSSSLMAQLDSPSLPADLTLPGKNPFIPENLTVLDTPKMAAPIVIENSDRALLYYWGDSLYQVPDISWTVQFKSPLLDGSLRQTALISLYLCALNDALSPLLSQAGQAGLQADFSYNNLKLNLRLEGYSPKAPLLFETILSRMKKLKVSPEDFAVYKDSLLSQNESRLKELPYIQALEMMEHTLLSDATLPADRIAALESITLASLNDFAAHWLDTCFVQGMLTGNLRQEDAEHIGSQMHAIIQGAPYPPAMQMVRQVLLIPNGQGPYLIEAHSPMMGNAALLSIQEGSFSIEKSAAHALLSAGLSQDFFYQLRTKQQTGYIAKTIGREYEKQLFQNLLVQSSTHSPQELLARFELFLEDLVKDFATFMPVERCEQIRTSLIDRYRTPPTNLSEMRGRLAYLAFERDGNFQYIDQLIATLETLSYEKIGGYASDFFSRKNGGRLAILIEGVTPEGKKFKYQPVNKDSLKTALVNSHQK